MKPAAVGLFVVISAIAIAETAYANQELENTPNAITQSNQAGVLLTEPATINSNWINSTGQTNGQTNNLKPTNNSILLVPEQGCKKINTMDLIKNPGAIFQQCQSATNQPTPNNGEPVEYLKVPGLDSGIKLPVTQF